MNPESGFPRASGTSGAQIYFLALFRGCKAGLDTDMERHLWLVGARGIQGSRWVLSTEVLGV